MNTVADSVLVVWLLAKGGFSALYNTIPGTFNITGSNPEPGRGTSLVWAQAMQSPAAFVPAQTFAWTNDPAYVMTATISFKPVSVPSSPVPPTAVTIVDTKYNMQNDTLDISLVFQVNEPDLDSVYFFGPWSHPILAVDGAVVLEPFTSPQTFVLSYDVSMIVDSQTVTGTIDSRTFRTGLRSDPFLSIPFSWQMSTVAIETGASTESQ